MKKRFNIGLQIINIHDSYSRLVWRGITEMAELTDTNLIVFTGEYPDKPTDFYYQYNLIFELITNKKIDGLITVTGSLKTYFHRNEYKVI